MKEKIKTEGKAKVVFSVDSLKKALSNMSYAIVEKPQSPVMEMVKFVAASGQCRLIGTDGYATVSTQIPVTIIDTPEVQRWLMPYDLIKDLVATFGIEPVTILPDFFKEREHLVQYGKGFSKMPGDAVVDFPGNDKLDGRGSVSKMTLKGNDRTTFVEALRETMPFVAKDDLRASLNGVGIFCTNGEGYAVASDGHALRRYPFAIEQQSADFQAIVRAKFAAKLALMSDDHDENLPLEVDLYSNMIRVTISKTYLQARLIDEKYPDLNGAIPGEPQHECTVVRERLTTCLRRMLPFTDKITFSIALFVKPQQLTVWTMNKEMNLESEDTIDAVYEGAGINISFGAKNLLTLLNRFEDTSVTFGITAHNRAVLIWGEDDSIKTILMPSMAMPGQEIANL